MTRAILITQCLQRDFVEPLGPHEPLPNKLHVGSVESARLMGSDPATGPVAQVMQWARAQEGSELTIIHIRDWHDPDDPAQRPHLEAFGVHCVRGTRGAELVLGLDEGVEDRQNELRVDSIALNDFEDTKLGELVTLLVSTSQEPVRVGVVGVWTEAKVSFLLYDLKTRCRIDRLATCSALTASASRAQHFNALEQLRRLLGVEVFDAVGDFTEWLLPDGRHEVAVSHPGGFGAKVAVQGEVPLTEEDRHVLQLLYRESAELQLQPLSGGFSGAAVYRVRSRDALGHEQAPSVRGFVDLGARAGIKYSYAGMGQGAVRTFKALYESGAPVGELERVLRIVFEDVLGRFYQAAQYENLPLLEAYGFSARFADRVRENVRAIVGAEADQASLRFGEREVGNVADFYGRFLPTVEAAPEYHYVSWLHGDLNGANILIDARDNVWLIDFFHAARGHVLKDLAKLENDLLYIFTPLADASELEEAYRLTWALAAVEDLRAPLPSLPAGVRAPSLRRAWEVLTVLRGFVGQWCREDRHPRQMSVALLRYAAHTLTFDESSPLQRRWALASASVHAERVVDAMQKERELRVDWIASEAMPVPGRLGLTLCPGRADRARSLDDDLTVLGSLGTRHLVGLMTSQEMDFAGVERLPQGAEALGMRYHHLPIPDQGTPPIGEARALVNVVREALARGEAVVLHCMGGLGRSGTLAALLLVSYGHSAADAIAIVRRSRGPRAVESVAQEAYVVSWASEES